jgi:glycosyltransferase involved in cell wall biosynthesis
MGSPLASSAPLVSVCMLAYDVESFLSQAIDGILQQEVEFPTELVIGEDSSRDGTAAICRKYESLYPGRIRVLHSKQNLGQARNYLRTWRACRGKYIANCDGDDVWVSPTKLRRQVDFLEKNPDVGLSYTDVSFIDRTGKEIENLPLADNRSRYTQGCVFFELLEGNFIANCTAVFRARLLEGFDLMNDLCMDYLLWLHLSIRSRTHFLPERTTQYRIHDGGITSSAERIHANQRLIIAELSRVLLDFGRTNTVPLDSSQRLLVFSKLISLIARDRSVARRAQMLRLATKYHPGLRDAIRIVQSKISKKLQPGSGGG